MTAEELAEATKEFDREIPPGKTRPLTKKERLSWEHARRQPSRSVYVLNSASKGATAVIVELDSELLRRSDAYASSHKLTLSQLIEKSLRSALAFVE